MSPCGVAAAVTKAPAPKYVRRRQTHSCRQLPTQVEPVPCDAAVVISDVEIVWIFA